MQPCLAIFARWPVPGQTKTRLIPAIGAQAATMLHVRLLTHCWQVAQEAGCWACSVHWAKDGAGGRASVAGLPDWPFTEQSGADLGARMANAIGAGLAAGHPVAAVVGTDLPDLSAEILRQAEGLLRTCDVVIGPAADGGYYFIGMKKLIPDLFADIAWGTSSVLAQTMHRLAGIDASLGMLPQLRDLDRPEDLAQWPVLARDCADAGD